jgi:hypothetical protein
MRIRLILKTIPFLCVGLVAALLSPEGMNAEEPKKETVELESGLYYTVQEGDTLWDLSKHFFDSAWIWPDLWQENREIANPHWIYPGDRIRLFSREGMEALGELEEEAEPEVAVEPPEPPYYLYPSIDSVGFVRETPVSPYGTIFKVKEDKELIGQGDTVYIVPVEDVVFEPGTRFTVFRTLQPPIKSQDTKRLIGIQHFITGVVEITDVQPKFSIGKIVESCRTIKQGDLLMPYEARSAKIILVESKEGLEGTIIGVEECDLMFAEHAITFVDKGQKDGIQVGQTYSVYYQGTGRAGPKGKEEVLLSPVNYAEILILRAEETTATALVTKSQKPIQLGAKVHSASP